MTSGALAIALFDLVAVGLFIYGLHELNSPATARRGNRLAMIGMFIALVSVLVQTLGVGWWAIAIGTIVGAVVGIFAAVKVKMTAMPQMVALYNGAGGGAAALISTVEFYVSRHGTVTIDDVIAISLVLSAIIGAVSFAGSIVAFLKLQEVMTGRPVTYPGQQIVNALVAIGIVVLGSVVRRDARRAAGLGICGAAAGGAAARRAVRLADRRRRHAGRHLAAQLVHRLGGRDHRFRTLEHAADHLRRAGRRERHAADDSDGPRDESAAHQRAVRRVRRQRRNGGCDGQRRTAADSQRERRRRRDHAGVRGEGHFRSRLRHGRRAGAAQRQSARRSVGEARRQGALRDPSGRRPHAGPHERAARRSERSVQSVARHGGRQSRSSPRPTSRWSSARTT